MKKYVKRIIVGLFVIIVCLIGVKQSQIIQKNLEINRMEQVKKAVLDAAIQCYSIEGAYPNSLDYLKENYGLTINVDKYIVDYQCIGSNQLPQVKVLSK